MGAKRDQESCHEQKQSAQMKVAPQPPDFTMPDSPEDVHTVALDPRNPFEAVLIQMVETHRRKAKDYAGDAHPNQNFYDTATQLGQTGGHSVEALIATKQARLKVILPQYWNAFWETRYSQLNDKPYSPANEGIQDTLLDRAVYAVIALTIWNENGYRSQTPPVRFD